MLNFRPISNVIGALLVTLGGLMLTALPFSLFYNEGDHWAILSSSLITMAFGGLLWYVKYTSEAKVSKKEGYVIVTLGWILMVAFGMLPYIFSGTIPGFIDAFFEAASGMTTTGASVIDDIEAVPKGILFWRSMSQWIGGMGIIVLTVALLPMLGIGGVELFVAEAPGPTSDKIHPRIKETAKRLWFIYVGFTALLTGILWALGMTFYDAINHALTTMATGGFSTKNTSMIEASAAIQYVTALFMFIGGTNYTIIYFGLKGKLSKVWRSEEFRVYTFVTLGIVLIVALIIHFHTNYTIEEAFRNSLFMTTSMISTTGFVSGDYTLWSPGVSSLFFLLLFSGACAGSTSGGIKIIRHIVFVKNSYLEYKRILHPKAIIRLKIDRQIVKASILTHILVFLLVYITLFMWGTVLLTIFGLDLVTASSAVASAIGNVGPGLGEIGPAYNFNGLPQGVKFILSMLMIIGRLELFSFLILFSPFFWRTN